MQRPDRLRIARPSLLALCLLPLLQGCGPKWVYTFVEAENIARPADRPILVFYRDHLDVASGQMMEMLARPEITRLTNGTVLCSLVSEYDPNRRFVAQYGVVTPPALVVVHPDGTYHAYTGPPNIEQMAKFLTEAKPPGKQPNVDIQIPRPTDFLIRAEGIYERAVATAERQNRRLLIIYKWWLDGTSTELLKRMTRPEVASRCTETVNCVLDWDYVPNRAHAAQYGVTSYPAIILVDRNGEYRVLEGMASVEEIVRFLTRPEAGGRRGAEASTTPAQREGS